MPRLSCWFICASLIYLAVGFTLGALLLANKGVPLYPVFWSLLPAHMEFLLMGWVVQLALGMAFWILPRFPQGAPRGNEQLIWLAFILINLGIWIVAVQAVVILPWLILSGRIIEIGGVLSFVIGSWRRVKAVG